MPSGTVHVSVIDTRTPVGVAQLIDTMWVNVGKARARVREINTDHKQFPNQVAWLETYQVVGGKLSEVRPRARGEGHGSAVLTEQIVREARILFREGARTADLADLYGVSRQAMSNALYGRTWAHVA